MASLYRKHRPQRFSELVGQDHVTTALRNAVTEDRVGHAYLFSGPRGTGKTTTARILARALNCLSLGDDGEPCGKCENCVALADGTFFDLVELDAASNNGVDAMRELIQSVHLGLGPSSRRKIYIVDEVHMLSAAASNTLLKTLEEPPAHVVFVLATTDPQKVLPTIRSRTQHFEFTLLTRGQMVAHLTDILGREGVDVDDTVLDLVVRRAAGSARDALSLLDQALAVGGGSLDAAAVQQALGAAPFELRLAVLEAAAVEDVAGALAAVHELLAHGHDVRRVADDILRSLRDAFMCANAAGRVPYDGPEEEAERLAALARGIGNAALVRAIEVMGAAIVDMRQQTVADPRLVLEVAVVRLARRDARTSIETLLDRVERLERRLEGGGTAGAPPAIAPESTPPAGPARDAEPVRPGPADRPRGGPVLKARPRERVGAEPPEPAPPAAPPRDAGTADAAPAAPLSLDDVVEAWPVALGALTPPVRAAVQDAQPIAVEDGVIVFGVPKLRQDAINARFRAEAATVKQAFATRLGFEPRFMLRAHDFDAPGAFGTPAAGGDREDGMPALGSEPTPLDEDQHIDLDDLVDAPAEQAPDATARLVADFGAQVVEERPREQ